MIIRVDLEKLKKENNRAYEYRLLNRTGSYMYKVQKLNEFLIFKWWVDCSKEMDSEQLNEYLTKLFVKPVKDWEVIA